LVGLFVRILRVRPAILAPITALITILGVYTINNSVFDIFLMIGFGIVGYLMKKAGFDPGPMVLAFVLGSLVESSARRSMLIFGGDPTGFFTRPLSGSILAIFVVVALLPVVRHFWRRKSARVETAPGVAEVDSHSGPGDVGVAGDDGGSDVVVLPADTLDVAGVGERVRVAKSGAGQHDHHRTE
jgi:putative tricarboxylic transport membrane protein